VRKPPAGDRLTDLDANRRTGVVLENGESIPRVRRLQSATLGKADFGAPRAR